MIKMDWTNISVPHSYDTATIGANDIIMTISRDPSNRNTDDTYTMERGFLDYIGEKRFIHKTFEVQVYGLRDCFYIEFSPTEIKVGTNICHKRRTFSDAIREHNPEFFKQSEK